MVEIYRGLKDTFVNLSWTSDVDSEGATEDAGLGIHLDERVYTFIESMVIRDLPCLGF
jgi:hypothetical protein